MDITPYYNEGALFITQTVDFTNGDTELDRIVFSLPVNAYRRSSTAPMDSDEFDAAFTDNYTPGGVEFKSITVNDSKVKQYLRYYATLPQVNQSVYTWNTTQSCLNLQVQEGLITASGGLWTSIQGWVCSTTENGRHIRPDI